ncbi:MAG: NAD-dependent aldehyde dehydrogenase [Methylocystaceae bacterium]|nr:MAG: NAD-dependent aldehyde dehydrogenase [Methylocystaceae bacterium]
MEKSEVITTLNELAEISRDGEQGFLAAAEDVENPTLKTVFRTAAARCAEGAKELESKIVSLGGEPSKSGSMPGAMHRAWTNLKAALTSRSEQAVLEEVDEDAAKDAYQQAIAQPLPPEIRSMVQRQYQGVKENHDRVRSLRDAA